MEICVFMILSSGIGLVGANISISESKSDKLVGEIFKISNPTRSNQIQNSIWVLNGHGIKWVKFISRSD